MTQQNPSAPESAQVKNLGSARDLRNLLEAVLEALAVPHDADDYRRRLDARAGWAAATIKGALADDPADIGWNADFLRSKMDAEQAEATRRAGRGDGQ